MAGTRREASRLRASVAPLGAVRGPAGTRAHPYGSWGPRGLFPRSEFATFLGEPYPADVVPPATEREAMGLPPFGRGVALLANAVAGTDWEAVRWDQALGVAVRRPDQPAILANPDPTTTPWHYRWAAVMDLVVHGNHFALCGSTDAVSRRPGWLVPVAADRVAILSTPPDPETGAVDYWWSLDGEPVEPFDPTAPPRATMDAAGGVLGDWRGTMLHVSAGNRSGEILGLGILEQYRYWLGGAVAAEAHAGAYFAGGALPPAVLQSPTVLTQAQAADLKASWRAMVNTREPVIMPNGYTLTPIVSDALNAQMVESRQWNAADIAMMLGIPSYKLGLAGPSMTYQNIESADIEFVRDSVDRYAEPLSQAFSKYLMPAGTSVAWQYAGRMRADQKTTAEVLTTYVSAGIMTEDEARAAIGRPPLERDDMPKETPPELEAGDAANAPDQVAESPSIVAGVTS